MDMIIFPSNRKLIMIPAGLIIFYNGVTAPTDWTAFSDPDGNLIMGAGSTYDPGDTGGSNTVATAYGGTSSSGGAHSYGSIFTVPHDPLGDPQNDFTSSAGDHTHTYNNASLVVAQDRLKLIQADKYLFEFPINGVVLGLDSFSGLSIINNNNRFLSAASTPDSVTRSASLPFGSGGAHNHYTGVNATWDSSSSYYPSDFRQSAGSHSGSLDMSSYITENLKKVLLSAWTNASAKFDMKKGMVGLWESNSPPVGWNICNGSNGTPDLRDCFVQTVSNGSENGTASGDNTVDVTALTSVNHSASHSHEYPTSGSSGQRSITAYHPTYSWSHGHSITESAISDLSWLPPYYALSFIMRSF